MVATKMPLFIEVIKYLQENDDEQTTISDLADIIAKLCPDPTMAYSNVWMKKKSVHHFANINGKWDVVTFVITTKKILAAFYKTNDSSSNNIEEQKQRIIKMAAKFIKNDVKICPSSNTYPSMNEFQSIDNCLEYLTPSWKSQ